MVILYTSICAGFLHAQSLRGGIKVSPCDEGGGGGRGEMCPLTCNVLDAQLAIIFTYILQSWVLIICVKQYNTPLQQWKKAAQEQLHS